MARSTRMDKLSGPDWYGIFKDLHAGFILDLAGDKKGAQKRYESAYKTDPTALRTVQAYGRFLSRNGSKDDALKVYQDFAKVLPDHPLVNEEMKAIADGQKLPTLVDSPQAGAAEALYGLGASIGRRGGEDLALIYLQLALYLQPSHPMALLSLGDLYEDLKKPDLAIKAYERVPANSPLSRNAEIQMAVDLDALDRTDEAKQRLQHVIAQRPKDTEAIIELGNIQRARKDFAGCADTYSKAIDTVPKPEKSNWVMFYFRGICYERSHQWPPAEADMKKALELFPEQPLVLNYLGYSWVDQGVHLDQGMDMIRRAVEQRPDDGYIVDSLGWAYFRTGNYDEAVKNLERAVELKPEDPTINDHLGDAYWRVGRMLEAHFQWSHAKDLKPEPEDLPKIEAKLQERAAARYVVVGGCQQAGRAARCGKANSGRTPTPRRPATAAELRALSVPLVAQRTGQGEPDAAGAWPPRRRLSRARKPGRVRRLRRPADLRAGRRTVADGQRRDGGAGRRRRRQSRAQGGARARRAHSRAHPGRVSSRKESARRGRARRRLVRCGRGAAPDRAGQRAGARRSAALRGARARPAPTCRFVSIRGRG